MQREVVVELKIFMSNSIINIQFRSDQLSRVQLFAIKE